MQFIGRHTFVTGVTGAQYQHWWRSTGTGGAVPALVAQYRHWWRSTGTGSAALALVAQHRHCWRSVQRGYSLGRALGSGWGPGPGSILA